MPKGDAVSWPWPYVDMGRMTVAEMDECKEELDVRRAR
jgi:hypothetical protein